MGSETTLTLACGSLQLELSPSIGGSISAFEWIDGGAVRPILRQRHSPLKKSLDASSFPLVPYANRIRGGEFHYHRRTVRIAPNMADDPNPLHGQGWLNPWSVHEASGKHAVLHYRHEAGEWPWTYEASQEFRLDEEGLTVSLACTNLGAGPMPCGLGQHPYFHCTPQTRIDAQVASAWTIDEDVLPLNKVPAQGRYDLKDRLACTQDLDNGFGGWDGEAHISDPDWPYEIRLTSDVHFLQIYSPPGGGIFAAEPVSHANAALNEPQAKWPELGMCVLEQGQEVSMMMRVDVIARCASG